MMFVLMLVAVGAVVVVVFGFVVVDLLSQSIKEFAPLIIAVASMNSCSRKSIIGVVGYFGRESLRLLGFRHVSFGSQSAECRDG